MPGPKSEILFETYRSDLRKFFEKMTDEQWEQEKRDNPHLMATAEYIGYKRPERTGK